MAYARWNGESDVYFIKHVDGDFQCVGCTDGIMTINAAIGHLKEHRMKGDRVPQYAIDRLIAEKRAS